jgi:hypothetical protein
LLCRAKAGLTIYYSELGEQLGIPARGPWKPILDDVGLEERGNGRPDITYLVIARASGLPGQIEFELAKPPTQAQRKKRAKCRKRFSNIIVQQAPNVRNGLGVGRMAALKSDGEHLCQIRSFVERDIDLWLAEELRVNPYLQSGSAAK